jgi:hypothetical protein
MDDNKILTELNERFVDAFRVHGDTAVVSARSSTRPGQFNCYVDTYARCGDRWLCVHASVWPLHPRSADTGSRSWA